MSARLAIPQGSIGSVDPCYPTPLGKALYVMALHPNYPVCPYGHVES